jgi:hypothetical protein
MLIVKWSVQNSTSRSRSWAREKAARYQEASASWLSISLRSVCGVDASAAGVACVSGNRVATSVSTALSSRAATFRW